MQTTQFEDEAKRLKAEEKKKAKAAEKAEKAEKFKQKNAKIVCNIIERNNTEVFTVDRNNCKSNKKKKRKKEAIIKRKRRRNSDRRQTS